MLWIICALLGSPEAPPPPAGSVVRLAAGSDLRAAGPVLMTLSGTPTTITGFAPGTRLPVAVEASYWDAASELARLFGGRVTVRSGGQEVQVTTGVPSPSSVSGAFRTSVTSVTSRRDFDSGRSVTDVAIALHWESRIPVVRVDAEPTLTGVATDLGAEPVPVSGRARVAARDSEHLAVVRLAGVPRDAKRLTRLEGEFRVTAAPRLLSVNVPTFGVAVVRDGVTVTLGAPQPRGGRVEAVLTLQFPPTDVVFESFEAGTRLSRTRLELVSPTGERFKPVSFDDEESPNAARVITHFDAALPVGPGWAAVVTTPAPLQEYRVRFDLRDVPLP